MIAIIRAAKRADDAHQRSGKAFPGQPYGYWQSGRLFLFSLTGQLEREADFTAPERPLTQKPPVD